MSDCIIDLHAFPFCIQRDILRRHCIIKLLLIICVQIPAKESVGFSFRCFGHKLLTRSCGKCQLTSYRQDSIRCLQIIGHCIHIPVIENPQLQTSVRFDLATWQCIVLQMIKCRIISTCRCCDSLPGLSGQILYLL